MEVLGLSTDLDFIQLLFPPLPPFKEDLSLEQKNDFLLFGAILCDLVWKLRNKIHFEGMLLEFDVLEANILRLWLITKE